MADLHIGVDLGGTKVEAIALDSQGVALFRQRRATPRQSGYRAIVDAVVELAQEAAASSKAQSYSVGIGIPGVIDSRDGRVINANTTELIGHPLQSDLDRAFGFPVAIENDANCFALAEARSGAGRGYDCVFGVIMGTGCGGGIVLQGRTRRGAHGIAGEWGHLSIDPQGPLCWCGQHGCVETVISGSGLQARHRDRCGQDLGAPQIIEAYRRGDAAASASIDEFLNQFGRALGGLISVLDPDCVVLGGGLSAFDELYTEGVVRVRRSAFHPQLQTPIVRNELGDSAGVFGAAWLGAADSGEAHLPSSV